MPEPDDLLTEWRKTPQEFITLASIRLDKALQPRNIRLAPIKDHAHIEARSREHVSMMAGLLAAHPTVELEPVLVARIGNRLLLVDGHHRLMAYRRAGRQLIPARVTSTDMATAGHVSKLVNLDSLKLPMHKAQRLESAWQYLAHVTQRGKQWLPEGHTCKTEGARFGISLDTVSRMIKISRSVNPEDFHKVACDPGTEWPLWKHCVGNAIRDRFGDVDDDTRAERDAMSLAKALAKVLDKHTSETHHRAVSILKMDKARHLDSGMLDSLTEWASNATEADSSSETDALVG